MKKSAELYLSAREAAAELAISPATLYAYVSRGLIRSEPSPDSRSHRYRAEDIRGLKERRVPSPEPRGLRNFDADLPVLDSAIGTITEQGAIYRGVNCVELSEKDTLEHTATLLWDVTSVDPFAPDNCPSVSDAMRTIAEAAHRAAPIDRAIAVLALATSANPGAFTRAPEGRAMVGARILRLLVATMLNTTPSAEPLHLQIARAWAPDHKHAPDLIRRALVLLADHELNASTFTVRCAASTGISLYDAIIAGLAALKGPKHRGAGGLAARLGKMVSDHQPRAVHPRARGTRRALCRLRSRRLQARRSTRDVAAERAHPRGRGAQIHQGSAGADCGSNRRVRQHRLCARRAGAQFAACARQRAHAVCDGPHRRMGRARQRTIAAWQADPAARSLCRSCAGAGRRVLNRSYRKSLTRCG